MAWQKKIAQWNSTWNRHNFKWQKVNEVTADIILIALLSGVTQFESIIDNSMLVKPLY